MKKIILCCVLVVGFVFGLVGPKAYDAGAAELKIGVIDMQEVVRKSAAGKKAMDDLNKKFENLQKQLQEKQEELKAFKEDLEKKGPLMSDEARTEKERKYKKMLRDFKDKSEDAQFEMRQAESKGMEPIIKDLERVVTRFGEESGYTLILEKNMPGMYFVAPGIELTDDVIKAYDKETASSAGSDGK